MSPERTEERGRADLASPVSIGEIREAAGRLAGVARRTPLVAADLPAGDGGPSAGAEAASGGAGRERRELWLKCENLQHGGAFKLRGAYNFISRLSPEERERGLITFSSGNHAQGVAYAAREFGARAVIVMPEDAPRVKRRGTRELGGEIVLEGTTTEERKARAHEIAGERGLTVVPPFDHRDIIAGQGSVGLEIVEQLREAGRGAGGGRSGSPIRPAQVLVPIGGGGLISGVAAALDALAPDARVVGVEPEGAASMKAALEAGRPVTLDRVETVADGLKPVRPGDLTFEHTRRLVDEVVTVSDEAIRRATVRCFDGGLVVEPSGAATVAAVDSGRVAPPSPSGGATVAVISGGNIDPELVGRWIVEDR